MMSIRLRRIFAYFLVLAMFFVLTTILISNDIGSKLKVLKSTIERKRNLLAIFTTFKNDPNKAKVYQQVIMNWSSFGTDIQPFFFYNSADPISWDTFAVNNGWIGLPLGLTNRYGTPKLKDMYKKVIKSIESEFYGFCNGDILFDRSLVSTLKEILHSTVNLNKSVMVIGRRTNIDYQDYNMYYNSNSIVTESLKNLATSKGSLNSEYGEDYFFISSPEKFPWHNIKDVVIGRPVYDNYLVSQAIKLYVPVIDATKTLLALHLTSSDGGHAGFNNVDGYYNIDLIGEKYEYHLGGTTNAQYLTKIGINGDIVVAKDNKTIETIKIRLLLIKE